MKLYVDVVQEAAELHKQGKFVEAAFLYENLLGNQPDDPVVLYMYGTMHTQTKHFGTAITMLEKAVKLEPRKIPEAWHNLAAAYRNEGHTEDAKRCNRRCLEIRPSDANTLAMMAGCHINTGQPGMAIEYADRSLALDPDNFHAHNHKALALLELGRYKEAWPHYELRYNLTDYITPRPYTCPKWDGKPVGKLAIHGEQGLGDEIMFMSCIDELEPMADEIVVECASRLVTLFSENWPNIKFYGTHDELIKEHDDADAYIPMGSLPTFCRYERKDFPGTPYLNPKESRVQEMKAKLAKYGPGPYIGIAWHGGTKQTHQELRNPPLEHFENLVEHIRALNCTPISLQYGEDGAAQSARLKLPHWQYAIDDMPGQAALIAALDLVITPCQTAVHMAGSIGTECWCLTPSQPAWRYKIKGDMDWYNNVQLFRQRGADWGNVFDRVNDMLDDRFTTEKLGVAAC